MEEFKEVAFLKLLLNGLIDKPEKAVIERTIDDMGILLTLTVTPEDMGKVIGKQGNTAKAIRTILQAVGFRNNGRVNLKITEPDGTYRYENKQA